MNKYQESLNNLKSIPFDEDDGLLEDYETMIAIKENGDAYEFNIHETISILQELIDKQEKYRWHDLRKDPKDLPIPYCQVLCFNGYEYITMYAKSPMFYKCLNIALPIISWKYIEEFKDE